MLIFAVVDPITSSCVHGRGRIHVWWYYFETGSMTEICVNTREVRTSVYKGSSSCTINFDVY